MSSLLATIERRFATVGRDVKCFIVRFLRRFEEEYDLFFGKAVLQGMSHHRGFFASAGLLGRLIAMAKLAFGEKRVSTRHDATSMMPCESQVWTKTVEIVLS
jgi:hypothetical protein